MAKKKIKKGNYEKCWSYLKESRSYFLAIIIIFVFSILIGFFFPAFLKELINSIIQNLAEKTQGMGFPQLFLFILENNVMTSFFGLILGVFLGVIPLILVVFNGYVLGFVSVKVAGAAGYFSLVRLLPHGIFEMPALIISLGLGLKLGRFIFSRNPGEKLKYDLENSLRVFLFIVIPLLFLAAIIETALIFVLG